MFSVLPRLCLGMKRPLCTQSNKIFGIGSHKKTAYFRNASLSCVRHDSYGRHVRGFTEGETAVAPSPQEAIGHNVKYTISKEELLSLPRADFNGRIEVIWSAEDHIVERALRKLRGETLVGLDTESSLQSKDIVLLQLATDKIALLFRSSALRGMQEKGCPPSLKAFLEDPTILKAGQAPYDEIAEMKKLFGVSVKGLVDIAYLARILHVKPFNLRALVGIFLRRLLSKAQQTSNWDRYKLSLAQKHYAAADAAVCRELLIKMLEIYREKHNLNTLQEALLHSGCIIGQYDDDSMTLSCPHAAGAKGKEAKTGEDNGVFPSGSGSGSGSSRGTGSGGDAGGHSASPCEICNLPTSSSHLDPSRHASPKYILSQWCVDKHLPLPEYETIEHRPEGSIVKVTVTDVDKKTHTFTHTFPWRLRSDGMSHVALKALLHLHEPGKRFRWDKPGLNILREFNTRLTDSHVSRTFDCRRHSESHLWVGGLDFHVCESVAREVTGDEVGESSHQGPQDGPPLSPNRRIELLNGVQRKRDLSNELFRDAFEVLQPDHGYPQPCENGLREGTVDIRQAFEGILVNDSPKPMKTWKEDGGWMGSVEFDIYCKYSEQVLSKRLSILTPMASEDDILLQLSKDLVEICLSKRLAL